MSFTLNNTDNNSASSAVPENQFRYQDSSGIGGFSSASSASGTTTTFQSFGQTSTTAAPAAADTPGTSNPTTATASASDGGYNFTNSATISTRLSQGQSANQGNNSVYGTLGTNNPTVNNAIIVAPYYESKFRGVRIWNEVKNLVTAACQDAEEGAVVGQQLCQLLQKRTHETDIANVLLDPLALKYRQPDMNLRSRLAERRLVTVTSADQKQHETTLTNPILEEVCSLADSLYISEEEALSLYHYVSTNPNILDHCELNKSTYDSKKSTIENHNVGYVARKFYFYERSLPLITTLMLLQHRQNNTHVAKASDSLLQAGLFRNLVHFIPESTSIIDQMLQKSQQIHSDIAIARPTSSSMSDSTRASQQLSQLGDHLGFWYHARQTAAECLFFIAYEVQLTADEVASLIDLIQDLTNDSLNGTARKGYGLHILNPFKDVPDPYEGLELSATTQGQAFMGSMSWTQQYRKEKEYLTWQRELVDSVHKTGHPALLRCIGTLIVTCIAALDTQTVLMDRNTHEPNSFGKGNALLPPDTLVTNNLRQVDKRLNKNAVADWSRKDILGILMAAYSILLRTSPSSATSPRTGDTNYGNGIDIRNTFSECIQMTGELKSFTFARLSLIPALQIPSTYVGPNVSTACDVADFLLSSLANFASRVLEVISSADDRPISRAKWNQDAEEYLRLQRLYEEQQQKFHGQFRVAPDQSFGQAVATSVNLFDRPDCMDDVVAFASAICSMNAEYALRFWSQEEHVDLVGLEERKITRLMPSRALQLLQVHQNDDHSLRPSYLTFLAALALARNEDGSLNGGAVIYELYANGSLNATISTGETWETIVETFRHYVRELNPNFSPAQRGGGEHRPGMATDTSTSYYYFDDVTSRNSFNDSASDVKAVTTKELGEENTSILLSHLALIANVASNHPEARLSIVRTTLPIVGPDQREIVGQDGALNILFTLAIMPVNPEVRGMVFKTIASLLDVVGLVNPMDIAEANTIACRGWELLEACQIVPIRVLEQYQRGNIIVDAANTGLSFPTSSVVLATDARGSTWIPLDPRFSIIYEMEFVESFHGFYPSTEGFLRLLNSLICAGGLPASIGSDWRAHSGCTPYVEYVINLVLPRAVGNFQKLPRLPFRSLQDSNRLISLALDVIESILSRYCLSKFEDTLPTDPEEVHLADRLQKATFSDANIQLGCTNLAHTLVITPKEGDAKLFLEDFLLPVRPLDQRSVSDKGSIPVSTSTLLNNTLNPTRGTFALNGKSPGFLILASLLSSSNDSLLRTIVYALKEGRRHLSALESDRFSLAYALYGATTPTLLSAKEGARNNDMASMLLQELLKPLFPALDHELFSDATLWEGRVVRGCLRLFNAAIARENLWNHFVLKSSNSLKIVPFLYFRKQSVPEAHNVRCGIVSQLLLKMDFGEIDVLSEITDCVKFGHFHESFDVEIATAATAIVFYVDWSLHHEQLTGLIYQNSSRSSQIMTAFGSRMIALSGGPITKANINLLQMILNRHLFTLRLADLSKPTLTHIMLGFPLTSHSEYRGFGYQQTLSNISAFDAILVLLENLDFVVSQDTSFLASYCYEIMFHVTRSRNDSDHASITHHAIKKLHVYDFWKMHLLRMRYVLSSWTPSENLDIIHSVSWLLKGVASELVRLSGARLASFVADDLWNYQPRKYEVLSLILFQPEGFVDCLLPVLPIEACHVPACTFQISEDAVRQSKIMILGAPEIVFGYELVDEEKLISALGWEPSTNQRDRIISWCNQWNHSTKLDCASSHVTDSLKVLLGNAGSAFRNKAIEHSSASEGGFRVLKGILHRFCHGRNPNRFYRSCDDFYFPSASRNLALAALMATRTCIITDARQPEDTLDATTCCILLANAITFSGASENENTIENERTSYLACTFISILQALPDKNVVNRDSADFLEPSVVLARLACSRPSREPGNMLKRGADYGLAALLAVIDVFGEGIEKDSIMFYQSLLGRITPTGLTVLQSLISAMSPQNVTVTTLLSKIASFPNGTDLLFDGDVLSVLREMALTYFCSKSTPAEKRSNYIAFGKAAFSLPDFLLSHLKLLNTMMASNFRAGIRQELSSKVLSILYPYKEIFEQTIAYFPLDMDMLHTALTCISYVKLHNQGSPPHCQRSDMIELSSIIDPNFENQLVHLSFMIATTPLPIVLISQTMLGVNSLPNNADNPFYMLHDGPKWWDFLSTGAELYATDMKGNEIPSCEIVGLSITAVDIMKSGLILTRTSDSLKHVANSSLLKALCKCVDSIRMVDSRFSNALSDPNLEGSGLEIDQIIALESKLAETVIQLLLMTATRLQEVKREGCQESFSKEVALSLDKTGLDMGLELSSAIPVDENQTNIIAEICMWLREEVSRSPL